MLKEARAAANVSIGELAKRLGVTRGTVQSYIQASDAGTIQINTLRRTLAALDLDLTLTAQPQAHTHSAAPRPVSLSRFSKPYATLKLSQLHGPETGQVQIPRQLWWQPDPADGVFSLANKAETIDMYGAVLGEGTDQDIARYINAERLQSLWQLIAVPLKARVEWERLNPELADAHI